MISAINRRKNELERSYIGAEGAEKPSTMLNRRRRRQKNEKKHIFSHIFCQKFLWCQLYRIITRDLLIGSSSFLRRLIALDLSYKSAQKRARTELYRRRRRRKTKVDEFSLKNMSFFVFSRFARFFNVFCFSLFFRKNGFCRPKSVIDHV